MYSYIIRTLDPIPYNPRETIYVQWPLLKRFRRWLWGPVFRICDTGWFGLKPLRTHILICGYQRSGTTMLLAMMEYAMPDARQFNREISGWRAATWEWRNHPVMISKVPRDILNLHRLRNFYARRKAKLKTIIMVRDPRDVLTSNHAAHDRRYFQDIEQWRMLHNYCRAYRDDPEVLFIRYEDFTADVPAMQKRIEEFTGEKMYRPFEDFHTTGGKGFDTRPLNGVRPVDRSGIGRWRSAQHRERMEEVLAKVPDFAEILVELGYEKDGAWVEAWRGEIGNSRDATPSRGSAGT